MQNKFLLFAVLTLLGCSCGKKTAKTPEQPPVAVPQFDADSAWHYADTQVAFGPRTLGSKAHDLCADFLAARLSDFGATVTVQEATLSLVDKTPVAIKNIIGAFQPENRNRVMLCAHWDSRPFADHDPDPANRNRPIDGANDGAGAVAVLLEIARQIGIEQPTIGIDIVFFDAEDWGPHHNDETNLHHGDWCMGSAWWAQNPHTQNYTARYGILLDMVSATGAQFYKEYFSTQRAPQIVKKVWDAAQAAGYADWFPARQGSAIEDDHLQVMRYRRFPCIDIIHYEPASETGFGTYWHTLGDNMTSVSRETMKAVGQTVMQVIYNER